MRAFVPCIHAVHDFIRLMDREYRAFGQNIQLRVGYNDCDFDDAIIIRVQTGHFHVNPYQVELIRAHRRGRFFGYCLQFRGL